MSKQIEKNYKNLKEKIAHHRFLYYTKDSPEISDSEYDSLENELQQLQKSHPNLIIDSSFNEAIGGEVKKELKKVNHSKKMLSLANVFNNHDFNLFNKRIVSELNHQPEYTVETKIDGVALSIIYKNGVLTQAATRGNGLIGEDVTHNILTIKTIPKKLKTKEPPEFLEVRGEVFIYKKEFIKMNEPLETAKKHSNPRNTAAGSIRQLNSKVAAQRPLSFFAYELVKTNIKNAPDNHDQGLNLLCDWGIPVNKDIKTCSTTKEVEKTAMDILSKKDSYKYEIDGAVIKLNDIKQREILGQLEKTPRWAVAWKFPSENKYTNILAIDFQVGRTGSLTPVATLEAVNIGGVVVKKASLHNIDEIKRLDIYIGDRVGVIRAGEVIPKVVEVFPGKERKEIKIPKNCPSCNTELKIDIKTSTTLFCPAAFSCPAQKLEKISYAIGRDLLNIDGLGKKQIEVFIKNGFIKSLPDIYLLKNHKEELKKIDGLGEKSIDNILNSVEASKKVTLDRFLCSLGILGIGKVTAKNIANKLKNIQSIMSSSEEELISIDDVGQTLAKSINDFFSQEINKELIIKMLEQVTIYLPDNTSSFTSIKVAITGTLKSPRKDFKEKLEKNGIEVLSTLSQKADFLVYGDNPGSKLQKAEKMGIEVIKEDEILEKIK